MDSNLTYYLENISYLALFLVVVFIAKWFYNLTTSFNSFKEIIENKNVALASSICGFIMAVTMIYIAVLQGPSQGLINDLINVSMYSGIGLLMLLLTRIINDKFLLSSFCNDKQIIEHQRLSVGLVQGGSYIAAGLIIAGSLTGEGSLISAVVFYLLGQVTLIIFSKLYDLMTSFNLQAELEKGNIAAAISFAATQIAIGIILLHSLVGEFSSWSQDISLYLIDALIALVLLPLVRLLVDLLLLPNIKIDVAIAEENVAVALIEGFIAISVAAVILYTL